MLTGFAYISSVTSNTVKVIDITNNTTVATIPVGIGPIGVSVSPDGKKIYTANSTGGTVSAIDGTTNTVVATIPVGSYPYGIVVSPDGSKVYAANFNDGTLSVINTVTNTVMGVIPVGAHALCVAESFDGTRLYVTDYMSHTVSIINTATNLVLKTINITVEPWGLAVSPDGSHIYVGSSNSNILTVINSTNYSVSTIIVNQDPQGISVSPDGKLVYAVNSAANNVSVISTATNTVTGTIFTSNNPLGVSFSSDGTRAYVPSYTANDITVINTSTNAVLTKVAVGPQPNTIGNFVSGGVSCLPVTFSITVNPFTGPTITTTGTLSALNTVYGTPSTAQVFNVSGSNMTAGILVTPPGGFEVSTDNITYSNSLTIGAAGTIASTQIFIRLKASTSIGTYSGPVILSSTGANATIAIGTSTIAPAHITITATDVVKTYGTALTGAIVTTGYSTTVLKNAETIGSVSINYAASAAVNATASNYIGAVTVSSASGGNFTASNYIITYGAGNMIVLKAPLTIKADDKSKVVGNPNPAFTLTYSGFVNNETAAQLISQPVLSSPAVTSTPIGIYPIIISGAASLNYAITYVPGTLTILPVVQTLVAPNTFTPNNDGINDTWDIPYLSIYPNCTVEVLNRYGEQVYYSKGYPVAWNGRLKGADLPVGTYYYIINLNNANKPFSGSLAIIR
jgi:gliding motility-associated-like protein